MTFDLNLKLVNFDFCQFCLFIFSHIFYFLCHNYHFYLRVMTLYVAEMGFNTILTASDAGGTVSVSGTLLYNYCFYHYYLAL